MFIFKTGDHNDLIHVAVSQKGKESRKPGWSESEMGLLNVFFLVSMALADWCCRNTLQALLKLE